jgi:hypothetical protein
MTVYIASPYSNAAFVRDVVHAKLVELGFTPMSQWAEKATGPEDFSRMTVQALREAARDNDRDLRASDVCLVLDLAHRGGETYCEFTRASEWGKAIVYCGKPLLSMWRTGVVRVQTLEESFGVLSEMREHHVEGARGHLLVSLVASR